jgi:hypothetical protein
MRYLKWPESISIAVVSFVRRNDSGCFASLPLSEVLVGIFYPERAEISRHTGSSVGS